MAAYKIAALQKALEDSVPSSDLERANKQYTELTVKYRDMLQRDGRLIQRTTNLEHLEVLKHSNCPSIFTTSPIHTLLLYFGCPPLTDRTIFLSFVSQTENESLRGQISAMNKELEITKEKLNTLEQAWDNFNATGKLRIRLIIFSTVIFIFQKKSVVVSLFILNIKHYDLIASRLCYVFWMCYNANNTRQLKHSVTQRKKGSVLVKKCINTAYIRCH